MTTTIGAARPGPARISTCFADDTGFPPLSPGDEKVLGRLAMSCNGVVRHVARLRLMMSNLRLVSSVARHHLGRGLDMEDLVQEGNVALWDAAGRFDPDMNVKFGTYATFLIEQSIRRALINTAGPIRIPAYLVTLKGKWRRAAAEIERTSGRPPEDAKVAAALGLKPGQMVLVRRVIDLGCMKSWGDVLEDLILDGSGDTPAMDEDEERCHVRVLIHMILAEVERLDMRAAVVLCMRFGFGGGEPMTMRDVADAFGLTKEMIRKIEKKGLCLMGEIAGRDGYWADDDDDDEDGKATGPGGSSW